LQEERVPSTFTIDAVNLGHLDPSSIDEDLQQGTKVELPFWLAKALASKNMVAVELPKCYGHTFLNHMRADPSVINLRDKSPFYYEVSVLGMLRAHPLHRQ
jgi:GINS complex subunit 3